MEEVLKALAPWPILQGMALGMIVAALGFWAMRRGMQDSKRREDAHGDPMPVRLDLTEDERRAQWKAHEQLSHISENSFAVVKHTERFIELQLTIIAALNRLGDGRWNRNE